MDPNATLQAIEALYAAKPAYAFLAHDWVALRALRSDLSEWLARGGFEPDWALAPVAAKYWKGIR